MKQFSLFLLLLWLGLLNAHSSVLDGLKLTEHDSILVVEDGGDVVFSWQASKPLVPASLTKLATAHLAIDKWGLEHRFHTDFLLDGDILWVKGYGDPFLVSEELDKLVSQLTAKLAQQNAPPVRRLNIDNSYFDIDSVPGRSNTADPYNAPLSAVAANFNTVMLEKRNGQISSAEPQTPLTNTAKQLANTLTKPSDRVNLINAANAQSHFAELLLAKLAWPSTEIKVGQVLAEDAPLIYRHTNSHTLADVLRGTLEFSNNFMANQVFLKLSGVAEPSAKAEPKPVTFEAANDYSNQRLAKQFGWQGHSINDGAGLSRKNRLNAKQVDDLLVALQSSKSLFKKVDVKSASAVVYAKTGTLSDVRSYAGYIEFPTKSLTEKARKYRFVFNFNRTVAYRYRDRVLEQLLTDLEHLENELELK